MSQIKPNAIGQLPSIEPITLGLELLQIQAAPTQPFNHHLQRARTYTNDALSRDMAGRGANDRISRDRTADDRGPTDRTSQQRAAEDRTRASGSESRDNLAAAEGESRDDSTGANSVESAEGKTATEERDDTDSGEQTDTLDADATSKETQNAGDADDGDADDGDADDGDADDGDVDDGVADDGVADSVDVADMGVGDEPGKAGLPTEETDRPAGGKADESASARIDPDGAQSTDANANGAVAEEQGGATMSKDAEPGRADREDGADGRGPQAAADDDPAMSANLTEVAAEAAAATDRSKRDTAPGGELAEENAVQPDPAAREGRSAGGNAGANASIDPNQHSPSEMQDGSDGKDGHSPRREKKATNNAANQSHVADAAPQQPPTDDPATVAVDLKTTAIEPTSPTAGQPVDSAEGSIKPAGGTVDSHSSGSMRDDANRPGKAAAAARASANADQPESADQARFVSRVARAFEAMGDRNGPIRLKLSPAELGSLRIEISIRGGVMTAKVEAETSTAKNLLLDNLPALRDRLAQQGIKIQQFDVDLSDRSPGGLPDQRSDHADSDGRRERRPAGRRLHEETDREEGGRQVGRPGEESQLNVIV